MRHRVARSIEGRGSKPHDIATSNGQTEGGARLASAVVADRVLVAEPLAERGLDAMRNAGLDVEVKTGLTPEELCAALPGVAALVIRSATQVTADVLAAGTDLVVVGRAG